jgi:prefoldin subunit 5
MILTMQDEFLNKIESYKNIIDTNISKLNTNEQNLNELIQQTQEIKNLIEELSDVIKSCTYNLNVSEIQNYINNFKNVARQKSREIIMLIDEIKYNLSNYLALKSENPDKKAYTDIFNSKEEEISKLLLENENLKIQIENITFENDIISQFLEENNK